MTHHTQNLGQIEINRFRHHLGINLNLASPLIFNKEMRQIHTDKYARWRLYLPISIDFSLKKFHLNFRAKNDHNSTCYSHCLKIIRNVAFEFCHFGIFHHFLSYFKSDLSGNTV